MVRKILDFNPALRKTRNRQEGDRRNDATMQRMAHLSVREEDTQKSLKKFRNTKTSCNSFFDPYLYRVSGHAGLYST